MGDEFKFSDYDAGKVDDDDHVSDWELGLPTSDDLTPLSQPLISPELASAFSISPEPYRTTLDVNRASHNTFSSLRGHLSKHSDTDKSETTESRKSRRIDGEEADSNKKSRLVWTPQLHKRFVDVVAHLGIKNAVPKTIMQMMNVEGLTRENVASHLQKYRLYLKRMHGLSSEGPSASDHLFRSLNDPNSIAKSNDISPIPMYRGPQMVPMPIYPGFEYSSMSQNNFGSVNSYQLITPSDK